MSLRKLAVVTLALVSSAYGADSCCFVVQDEAHEVYWVDYVTDVYTVIANTTSTIVATTSSLVNENPVALYPNPAFTVPQKIELLDTPVPTKTGGLTIASPTGFWAYSTVKVFTAAAVTDARGNVACGTLSSFSKAATDPAACLPTFTGINSNAAAYFEGKGAEAIEISLTTPFIHVPTRPAVKISPSEACAQGNGAENYGYPVQELIDHLASNEFYKAQYPGIENCLPAGPSIQRLAILAVETETPTGGGLIDPTTVIPAATTETPDPGSELTTTETTPTSSPTDSSTSDTPSATETSSTSSPTGSVSTSITVTTATVPTAIPQESGPTTPTSSPGVESPVDGGLLPETTSTTGSSSAASSTSAATPTAVAVSAESTTTETSTISVVPVPATNATTTSSDLPVVEESTTSSELPSTTESSATPTTSADDVPTETTEEPSVTTEEPLVTTEEPLVTTESPAAPETTLAPVTSVILNETTTFASPGATQTPDLAFEAFAVKEYVFWELMVGLMGLAVLGFL